MNRKFRLTDPSRVLTLAAIGAVLALFLALFNRAMPMVDGQALKYYSEGSYRHSIEILSRKLWLSPFETYLFARDWQELGEWKNAVAAYQRIRPADLKWEKVGTFFLENYAYYYSLALYDAERSGSTNWVFPDLLSVSNIWKEIGTNSFAFETVTGVFCYSLWKAGQMDLLTNSALLSASNLHTVFFSAAAGLALGDPSALGDFFEGRGNKYFSLVAPSVTNAFEEKQILSLTPSQAAAAFLAFTDWSRFDTAAKILKMHYSITGDYDFYVRNRALLIHRQGDPAGAFALLQKHWESGKMSDRTLGVFVALLQRSGADARLFSLLKDAVKTYPRYFDEMMESAVRLKNPQELYNWARAAGRTWKYLRQEHESVIFSVLLQNSEKLAREYAFSTGLQGHSAMTYVRSLYHSRDGRTEAAYRGFLDVTLSEPFTYEWLVSREYELALRTNYPAVYRAAVSNALSRWEKLSENDRVAFVLGLADTDPNLYAEMATNARFTDTFTNVRASMAQAVTGLSDGRRELLDWWNTVSKDWIGGFNREILNAIDRGQSEDDPADRYKTVYQNRDFFRRLSLEGTIVYRLNYYLTKILGGRRYHPLLEESAFRDLYPVHELPGILAIETNTNTALWILASYREESHFLPGAYSSSGAVGIAQLMPKTADAVRANMKNASAWSVADREDNVAIGVTHFSYLFRRYGSVIRALAAYNAGETVVNRWVKKNSLPPELWVEAMEYTETRNYIKKIFLTRYFYDRLYGFPRPPGIFTGPNR